MREPSLSGLLGVVHLPAMPGDPRGGTGQGGFAFVAESAMRDAEALAEGGADGIVLENFGSTPYVKGIAGQRTPPHQVAAMALLGVACRERFGGLAVGVNCLRSDAISALGIAAAAGLDFVRVNVHVGAYVTDQGVIEGEAHRTLRYRRELGVEDVKLVADVLVKHATPLAPLDPADTTRDALERGLADAVIVTGAATGEPVSLELLEDVRQAAGTRTVLIGSGLTPERTTELAPLADGAIVGTWLKRDGLVSNPVDVGRVRELVAAVRGRFRGQAPS